MSFRIGCETARRCDFYDCDNGRIYPWIVGPFGIESTRRPALSTPDTRYSPPAAATTTTTHTHTHTHTPPPPPQHETSQRPLDLSCPLVWWDLSPLFLTVFLHLPPVFFPPSGYTQRRRQWYCFSSRETVAFGYSRAPPLKARARRWRGARRRDRAICMHLGLRRTIPRRTRR